MKAWPARSAALVGAWATGTIGIVILVEDVTRLAGFGFVCVACAGALTGWAARFSVHLGRRLVAGLVAGVVLAPATIGGLFALAVTGFAGRLRGSFGPNSSFRIDAGEHVTAGIVAAASAAPFYIVAGLAVMLLSWRGRDEPATMVVTSASRKRAWARLVGAHVVAAGGLYFQTLYRLDERWSLTGALAGAAVIGAVVGVATWWPWSRRPATSARRLAVIAATWLVAGVVALTGFAIMIVGKSVQVGVPWGMWHYEYLQFGSPEYRERVSYGAGWMAATSVPFILTAWLIAHCRPDRRRPAGDVSRTHESEARTDEMQDDADAT